MRRTLRDRDLRAYRFQTSDASLAPVTIAVVYDPSYRVANIDLGNAGG